jgi:hypothetical protein
MQKIDLRRAVREDADVAEAILAVKILQHGGNYFQAGIRLREVFKNLCGGLLQLAEGGNLKIGR